VPDRAPWFQLLSVRQKAEHLYLYECGSNCIALAARDLWRQRQKRVRQYVVDACFTGLADRPEILETIAQTLDDETDPSCPETLSAWDPARLRAGRPQHASCEGCESLYVIHLYVRIAKRRAGEGKGVVVRIPANSDEQPGVDGTA
jgi:hypothetical protein